MAPVDPVRETARRTALHTTAMDSLENPTDSYASYAASTRDVFEYVR